MAVPGNLGGKVPIIDYVLSSHEQEIYPTTSLDDNCIELEFRTDWNFYVNLRQSYLSLNHSSVKGRSYDTYNTKQVGKEHEEETDQAAPDEET